MLARVRADIGSPGSAQARSRQAVRQRAAELGVADDIAMLGFVSFGPSLLDLYRNAHVFVHVSLTKASPRC